MTGTNGPVAVQASPENVQVVAKRRLERFDVGPPSVKAAAIAAHYSDQFALGSHNIVPAFSRKVIRDSYCSSIGNRYVAVHSVGHGPVEQTIVTRQPLMAVQKRVVG